jgi:hypothetical protein
MERLAEPALQIINATARSVLQTAVPPATRIMIDAATT